jgi:hypothetical protein
MEQAGLLRKLLVDGQKVLVEEKTGYGPAAVLWPATVPPAHRSK